MFHWVARCAADLSARLLSVNIAGSDASAVMVLSQLVRLSTCIYTDGDNVTRRVRVSSGWLWLLML